MKSKTDCLTACKYGASHQCASPQSQIVVFSNYQKEFNHNDMLLSQSTQIRVLEIGLVTIVEESFA